MATFRIPRISLLTLLVACAPLAAQTPTVDTSTVTITYTGSAFPNPQSVHVSNASNVSARISTNIEADGSPLTSAGNTPGVFIQNVTPTSGTTASVNIGVDSNVLGSLARRGAGTYAGAQLLISGNGCVDCVPVSLTLSITNGGSVNITYNGAPIPSSGLNLFAAAGGSATAQLTLTSTNPTAFTASANVSWITVTPASGNLTGSQLLTLSLFAFSLPTGPNSATVTVNAGGISTAIPIVFNVGTGSGLTLSPNPMNFQYVTSTGSFPTGQTQNLTISGASSSATYSATASSSPTWLLVGSGGGTSVTGSSVFTPLPVSVNVAALNLQVATTYTGTVSITTSDGLASTVTVNLTISATGGTGTGSLTFNATPGGVAPPAQQVQISGSGFFSAFAFTSTCGSGWLQVSPTSGQLSTFATTLTVNVVPASLVASAGTCSGTISLSASGGVFSNGTTSQTINVTTVIGGSSVSGPVASPASLVFNLASGSMQQQQQTFIVNGNGTSFSAQAFGNFTVSPTTGTTPAVVTVTAGPGSTSGTVVVTSSLGSQNVTVTVSTLSGNVLTANPSSLSLLSATVGTQNISINASQDSTGQHLTFSVVSAPSFVSYATPSTTTPTSIGVGINAMQLAPGLNTGNLVISSNGAANPTLNIPITVLAPGSTSGLVATPNPANLAGTPGGTPVTQTISLTGLSTTFTATASSTGSWLSVNPTFGTSPTTLTITANPAQLGQGTYTGTVTLTSSSTFATLLSIPVNFSVGTSTGTTVLTVSPTTLTFNYKTGDPVPAPQAVSLATTTGVAVNFTASTSAPWISLSPPAGSTPLSLNVTLNTASLSAGTQTGTITITAQGATPQTVTVTANVTAPPVLTVNTASASFSYRTGDPAPPSQSIQVNSSGAALPFTVSVSNAAWLSVTPTSGTTPATLTLAANPSGMTVGQYSATVTISSAASSQTVAVTLNVSAPLPTISEVHNGASNQPGPIAPGLIIVITGSAMGPDTLVQATPTGDLFPTTVSATRVLIGGFAAPMLYTSATQVSAIVPYEIAGRTSTFVQVEYLGQRSNAATVTVANTAPAIFTLNQSGTGPGAILNQDGSVNTASNPESVNRSIVVFATGEGQTIPAGVDGMLADGPVLPKPVFPVTASINNVPAVVQYAGAAPGLVAGLLQVNILVPAGATSGNVVIHIGGNDSQNGVTVAIR